MKHSQRIAVIGAGIGGLTCAYELQKAGHEVVVFEKNSQVGGRMASRKKDGFTFDIGADHLCGWYSEMKKYCDGFGISWEKMRFLEYAIVKDRQVVSHDQATDVWSKLRLGWQYLRTPKVSEDFFNFNNLADYDDESAYDFMKRHTGKLIADYLVDSFCSTYQFHRSHEVSKGVVFGIIHSLRNHLGRWDLYRTVGGMQALPDAFAKELDVKLDHPIQKVIANDKNCSVDDQIFDTVVFASTASATRKMYKNPTPEQEKILNKAQYASSISIAFRVAKKKLPPIAVVWVPYVEGGKISGYVNESMKGEELIKNDETLLCTWLHEDFAKSIMDLSDQEIFGLVKKELLKVCPWFSNEEELIPHDLQKWPEAMPKFYPGYLSAVRDFLHEGQGAQNVYFCGDYMNALWTEGSLRGGQRTAREIEKF